MNRQAAGDKKSEALLGKQQINEPNEEYTSKTVTPKETLGNRQNSIDESNLNPNMS